MDIRLSSTASQSGQVTYAKSYNPYGEVTQASGASQSAYGYTGEQQDASGMVYLRSRYYNAADGRFQSRDTWSGYDNQPMSYNFWNYVQSNPVNYTDPTGHERCWVTEYDYAGRADFAEKYVSRHNVDELNTYTAAGIGVQCYGTDFYLSDKDNSGFGIGQITNNQVSTAYGEKVGDDRGYGLLCWIKKNAGIDTGCECRTEQEMIDNYGDHFRDDYELEQVHDQKNPVWAVVYMQRRIQQVIDMCNNCNTTDKFIAAALGQNGPGMTPGDMSDLSVAGPNNKFRTEKYYPIDWEGYFAERIQNSVKGEFDTRHQLELFYGVARNLHQRSPTGWYIPSHLYIGLIQKLIKG